LLDDTVKELATGKNFAALTALFADSRAQTQRMWLDADYLLSNTEVHRQKFKNIRRDPRVTVTAMDATNPYHYAEVRGRVVDEVRGDVAQASIDELSQKYLGSPDGAPIGSERVFLKIAPDSQRSQWPGHWRPIGHEEQRRHRGLDRAHPRLRQGAQSRRDLRHWRCFGRGPPFGSTPLSKWGAVGTARQSAAVGRGAGGRPTRPPPVSLSSDC